MKKRIALVIAGAALVAACMTGCSNEYGFGHYTYTHIHFSDKISGHCATIEKSLKNEFGIEVKTKECGSLFLSEGTYIMLEDAERCPFCH